MRDLFPGYYRPTDAEFEKLWKECVFVFDANILLYLYRSSEATRKDFLNILTHLRDRIWLPHQAALEYQKNRIGEIDKLWRQYDTAVTNMLKQQKPSLASDLSRHPLLEEQLDNLQGKIDKAYNQYMKKLKQLGEEIQALKQKHPNWGEKDTIRDQIDDLFNGRVGRPYPSTELNNIYSQGAVRYENEQPPGYKDAKTKQGIKAYGDLVLWFQIIDYGRENNLPIVFVTDDRKEDWWQEKNGKTIGPRPELLQEYFDQTGQQIYLYQPKWFMEWAEEILKLSSAQSSKEEIQALGDAEKTQTMVIEEYQRGEKLSPNIYPSTLSDAIEHLVASNRFLYPSQSAVSEALGHILASNRFLYPSQSALSEALGHILASNRFLYPSQSAVSEALGHILASSKFFESQNAANFIDTDNDQTSSSSDLPYNDNNSDKQDDESENDEDQSLS